MDSKVFKLGHRDMKIPLKADVVHKSLNAVLYAGMEM